MLRSRNRKRIVITKKPQYSSQRPRSFRSAPRFATSLNCSSGGSTARRIWWIWYAENTAWNILRIQGGTLERWGKVWCWPKGSRPLILLIYVMPHVLWSLLFLYSILHFMSRTHSDWIIDSFGLRITISRKPGFSLRLEQPDWQCVSHFRFFLGSNANHTSKAFAFSAKWGTVTVQ